LSSSAFGFIDQQKGVEEKSLADKRYGGRAAANVAVDGDRRPSRHGVNTLLKAVKP
jgi:hypothetical protein